MKDRARLGVLASMFGSALASQVVLSGANFLVGILLIRGTSDAEYGYYVLMLGAIILAVSLQNSFIAPAMINRMTQLGRAARGDLTGGLYREQRRVIGAAAGIAFLVTLLLWSEDLLRTQVALLVPAAIIAMVAALGREYFRMVQHAYRRAFVVLRADLVYAALLVLGILLATITPQPAVFAALSVAVAALLTSLLLARGLRRMEAWNVRGSPGILRQIAPLAAWSTAGAAIHWTVTQGYAVLAAITLDIGAVAAIAATRMLAMPVILLSAGIGSLMLPLTARWLLENATPVVLQRLVWIAIGISVVSACYFAVLWLTRDWVFAVVLNKTFAHSDQLLMLWAATFMVMGANQQLLWLLIARSRFQALTALALLSAILATICSYVGMRHIGVTGAPLGVLVGELVNAIGILFLCTRETARDSHTRALPGAVIP